MINRILIRLKVLQILYACSLNGAHELKTAENELLFSLQKAYDLYHYLLLLIVDLTRLQARIQDNRKHKYMPTQDEMNPNTRLANNRFAIQLGENEDLKAYVNQHKISWNNDRDFLKNVLEMLLDSDLYARYLDNPDDSYEADKDFWRTALKYLINKNERITDYLEDKSIFWNDDLEIVESFAVKTIKRFEEIQGSKQTLLPMFKDEEDRLFAVKLFRESLLHGPEYRERIGRHMKNWETERLAHIDLIIMQMAIAELMNFPSIPIRVSLNEYIEAAKYYSTPKSGTFINGILDTIVNELKIEKLLRKD
ncbi:MAG: transcription antitermination factor NusB [Tannerellaceae bacterium]|jgi:N utilization substance protein B|nr:transcription antitermination factor NusB [Tannerellaceae bacterium]